MDSKNVIAAIALSSAVIVLYSLFFIPEQTIKNQKITESGNEIADAKGVEIIERKDGKVSLITQSGKYSFLIK